MEAETAIVKGLDTSEGLSGSVCLYSEKEKEGKN